MVFLVIRGISEEAHPLAIFITLVVAAAATCGAVLFVQWFDRWYKGRKGRL